MRFYDTNISPNIGFGEIETINHIKSECSKQPEDRTLWPWTIKKKKKKKKENN